MKTHFLLLLCLLVFLFACEKEFEIQSDNANHLEISNEEGKLKPGIINPIIPNLCPIYPNYVQTPSPFVIPAGDNAVDYEVIVDGDPRTYRVYVPPGYPGNGPYPVVFMFHGTGQDIGKISRSTRWHATSRNGGDFIVVYPQAEEYLMNLANGGTQMQTKWVTDGMITNMVDSTLAKDDIKFFGIMYNTIKSMFEVDCHKVYACGFSNGGAFVKTKLRHSYGDQLAATVSTGGIGSPITYSPSEGHQSPHLETCGTLDDKKLASFGYLPTDTLSLDPATYLTSPFGPSLENFAFDYGLPAPVIPTSYNTAISGVIAPTGDPSWAEVEFFDNDMSYRFRMLYGLTHAIPTPFATPSYPINYIPIYWDFMNAHSL